MKTNTNTKKIMRGILPMLILCLALNFAACGKGEGKAAALEGNLSDILASIYANVELDAEFKEWAQGLENTELTAELASAILGTEEVAFTEGLVSVPMMSSVAYQCVLLRVDEADVESAKQKILDSADPDKWVCVSAETVLVENRGNVIFFIMASKEEAYALSKAFQGV